MEQGTVSGSTTQRDLDFEPLKNGEDVLRPSHRHPVELASCSLQWPD